MSTPPRPSRRFTLGAAAAGTLDGGESLAYTKDGALRSREEIVQAVRFYEGKLAGLRVAEAIIQAVYSVSAISEDLQGQIRQVESFVIAYRWVLGIGGQELFRYVEEHVENDMPF